MTAGPIEKLILGVWTVLVSIFILGPLLIMIAISLTAEGYISLPTKGVSLRWYEDMLQQRIFLDAAMNSILLAIEATATAVVLGTAVALAVTRYRFPGRGLILLLSGAPLFVPLVMTGLAVLIFFSALGIGGPALRLYVAHVALTIPYIVRMVSVSLAGFDWNQELAARNLGASPLRAFLEVTLPQIVPGVVAGAAFAFIISFDDVGMSIFLTGAAYKTLPVELFAYAAFDLTPMIAAVSVTMIVFSAVFVLLIERLFGVQRVLSGETRGADERREQPAAA
jgi:putative spermidine/putrescine transport system permease protein